MCEFHEPCGNCGHMSESRVSDQLCIGMADPDIQEELMGEASKRLTVKQTLKFIEKKATGKRSANAIEAGAQPQTPSTMKLTKKMQYAAPTNGRARVNNDHRADTPQSNPTNPNRHP